MPSILSQDFEGRDRPRRTNCCDLPDACIPHTIHNLIHIFVRGLRRGDVIKHIGVAIIGPQRAAAEYLRQDQQQRRSPMYPFPLLTLPLPHFNLQHIVPLIGQYGIRPQIGENNIRIVGIGKMIYDPDLVAGG